MGVLLAGCGKKKNTMDFFTGANPESSAITMGSWDGETMRWYYNYSLKEEKEILKRFKGIEATKVEISDIDVNSLEGPIYFLEISGSDGYPIYLTWIDGYGIVDEEHVYRMKADFEEILRAYDWSDADEGKDMYYPHQNVLAKRNGAWDLHFMQEVDLASYQRTDTATMTVTEMDGSKVNVQIQNEQEYGVCFGEHFTLYVRIGDSYYRCPASDLMAFIDIAYELEPHQSTEKSFDLSFYGELPAGEYQILCDGMLAEFMID